MSLNIGTLTGILELDSRPFDKTLDQAGKAPDKLGAKLKSTGDKLTTHLTLPILAAGAAAVKLGNDFDATFNKMVGLAGVSRDEVDGLKKSVLDLSGKTAQAPQDLAEALYFIRSAGLDGQVAMDALNESAKASTAGLGDAAVIADALTSALNAYGAANLTAAQAADVLTATAREGKAEASELAPQFGRLLPVAAQLGISFDQVGAGLAFLSRNSGDAALSATQLSGVMNALLKPSEQSAEILARVGSSAEDIQASIRDKGLLATLTDLRARLGDSGFNTFFSDIQGMQGALALTGTRAGQAKQVFDNLADSTGAAGEAFDAVAGSDSYKMQQALADLQATIIRLGGVIAPFVSTVVGGVATVAEAFADLPAPVQNTILVFSGLLAAVGPVLSIVGRLQQVAELASTGLGKLNMSGSTLISGLAGFAGPVGLAAAGFGALIAITQMLGEQDVDTTGAVQDLTQALREQGDEGLAHVNEKIAALLTTSSQFPDVFKRAGASLTPFIDSVRTGGHEMDALQAAHVANNTGMSKFIELMHSGALESNALTQELLRLAESGSISDDEWVQMIINLQEASRGFGEASDAANLMTYAQDGATAATAEGSAASADHSEALGDEAKRADAVAAAIQNLTDKLKAQFDPLFAMVDAMRENEQAQKDASDAIAKYGVDSDEAREATERATQSALGYESATIDLQAAIANHSVTLDDAKAKLMNWAAQGLITGDQAASMARQFDAAAYSAESIPTEVHSIVTADTSQAEAALAAFLNTVRNSSGMVVIGGSVVAREAKATGGPVRKGVPVIVGDKSKAELYMQSSGGSQYLPAGGEDGYLWVPPADGEILPHVRRLAAGTPGAEAEAEARRVQGVQDVQFSVGAMSPADYLNVLHGRLADLEAAGQQFSQDWYAAWQKVEQVNSDAATSMKRIADEAAANAAKIAATHQAAHDNMYEVGAMSADSYLTILQSRLARAEEAGGKFSDDWTSIWQQIQQVNQAAVADEQSVAAEHMRIHDNEFAAGAMSVEQYRAILAKRLSMQQEFSDQWLALSQQIARIDDDGEAAREHLADNQYAAGKIAAADYRSILVGRLADAEEFSDEWLRLTRQIQSIDDDAAKAAQDAADKAAKDAEDAQNHELELLRNRVKYGNGNVADLKAMLIDLQSHTEKFSAAWAQLQDEINSLVPTVPASFVDSVVSGFSSQLVNATAAAATSIDVGGIHIDMSGATTDAVDRLEAEFPGIVERTVRNVARGK